MPYYQYIFTIEDELKKEMAIAMFSELGMIGFEEKDSDLIATSTDDISDSQFEEVVKLLSLTYSKSKLQDQNWNSIWESSFEPITVWDNDKDEIFAYVRAHFHNPPAKAVYDLIITPKMSFGTGHHATTYGMMSYMKTIDFTALSVVDFGTGTGVLAILAEKMGAEKILALDNDPWCIRNAAENVEVNKCSRITLKESDHFETLQQADVILANINLNIIKDNLALIAKSCSDATIMLFSGILIQDEAQIITALNNADINEIDVIKNDGWLIIAAKSGRQIAALTTGS